MPQSQSDDNRREYGRHDLRCPVKFCLYPYLDSKIRLGMIENVSVSGILFRSAYFPQIASILWIGFDTRSLKTATELIRRTVGLKDGFLARVVRVDSDIQQKNYRIAVSFLTKEEETEGL